MGFDSGGMMITNPLDKRRYFVAIRFKNGRAGIDCVMTIPEYRRMIRDFQQGKTTGNYRMSLDNIEAEMTFPLQEIDTVHAAPEVTE
jgi:hypothetical protein